MQKGFTLWFTGLSGAGKTTLSNLVHHGLQDMGVMNVELLDGEVLDTHLLPGLGFTKEDMQTHVRRIGWVAQLLAKNNIPNIVTSVSAHRSVRDEVRKMVEHAAGQGSFVEIFVDRPVDKCEALDTSGLYAKARRGEIKNFVGVNEPYEEPHNPELHIKTELYTPNENSKIIVEYLAQKGLVGR